MAPPAWSTWLRTALIVAAPVMIYGPGLGFPFVFDDYDAIVNNTTIRELWPPWQALSPPLGCSFEGRPLVNLSFALTFLVSGTEPSGHRFGNLVLHVVNALLVLRMLDRLLTRPAVSADIRRAAPGLSLAVALLWAVHPLVSEAVMYVAQRTELLASLFYLLTLEAGTRSFETARPARWAALAVGSFLLGIGCKQIIATAPLFLALVDRALFSASWRELWKERRGLYLGMLALAPLLAWRVVASTGAAQGFGTGLSPITYLATQGSVILFYLRLAVFPTSLSISHAWTLAEPLTRYWAEDLSIAVLLVTTLHLWRRRRVWALPGCLFFFVLAPTSSVVPVLTEVVAERRMYLPLLAPIVLVALGATLARTRWRALQRLPGAPVVAAIALAFGVTAAVRVGDYRTELGIWQDALAKQPHNPVAMWGAGDALERQGRTAEAVVMYERMAAKPYPYVGPASWGTRGLFAASRLYVALDDERHAARMLERALRHDPRSAIGMLYTARLALEGGDPTRAIALLEDMLEQPFLHDQAHFMLSLAYRAKGDLRAAQVHRETATRLAVDSPAPPRWFRGL